VRGRFDVAIWCALGHSRVALRTTLRDLALWWRRFERLRIGYASAHKILVRSCQKFFLEPEMVEQATLATLARPCASRDAIECDRRHPDVSNQLQGRVQVLEFAVVSDVSADPMFFGSGWAAQSARPAMTSPVFYLCRPAAARIRSAISLGRETSERWPAPSSTVVAFIRFARNRSRSGLMV
jgi:hypothetical protein